MDTIEKQFQEFYKNIKLTPAQKQDAIDKYTGVCKKLHDYYYPDIEYTGSTKLLIGSYGKHTSIRPARDVDVIFIMPSDKFGQYDDNTSNKQSQLLQDVKAILKTKYPNTPISAFGKIVKIEFSETKHDVELVPAWENDDGSFKIPNSEDGGSWIDQRYREEIKDITDSDAKTGKTKFIIRCIKKWSDNCSASLRSFQIEQMVLSFFSGRDTLEYKNSFLIKEFFAYFYTNSSNDDLKSHLKTALNRAVKACDYEADNKLDEAIDEWRKIFGDDFPKTIKSISGIQSIPALEMLQKQYPSETEEFLDKTYGIPFNIDVGYRATLDADILKQNGFRDSSLRAYLMSKLPVQKKKSLLFRVSHNVPVPYDIKWKVRNFGEEAKLANSLRGQIYNDEGYETRKESTLYYGEHYVQCYIIKNNKCVAMAHILVPIANNY